jgi:hypothetical protein
MDYDSYVKSIGQVGQDLLKAKHTAKFNHRRSVSRSFKLQRIGMASSIDNIRVEDAES